MLQAEVSSEDAEALTRQLGLRFYRTCVKDNLNVSEGNYIDELFLLLRTLQETFNDMDSCSIHGSLLL